MARAYRKRSKRAGHDAPGRLAGLMIEGKEIEGEGVVVALGVDSTGGKHLLGLMPGSTENGAVVPSARRRTGGSDRAWCGCQATDVDRAGWPQGAAQGRPEDVWRRRSGATWSGAPASQREGAPGPRIARRRGSADPHGVYDEGVRAGQGFAAQDGRRARRDQSFGGRFAARGPGGDLDPPQADIGWACPSRCARA